MRDLVVRRTFQNMCEISERAVRGGKRLEEDFLVIQVRENGGNDCQAAKQMINKPTNELKVRKKVYKAIDER